MKSTLRGMLVVSACALSASALAVDKELAQRINDDLKACQKGNKSVADCEKALSAKFGPPYSRADNFLRWQAPAGVEGKCFAFGYNAQQASVSSFYAPNMSSVRGGKGYQDCVKK